MLAAAIGQVRGSLRVGDDLFTFDHPLTVEHLSMSKDEIADLVGDGNAKVTVSFGMSDKDYGTGFDAHVSVSLACDQNVEIVGFAYESASLLAGDMIKDAVSQAKTRFEQYEEGRNGS